MSYPWGTSRRFNAYSDYFRKLYGERVQKITIDAGFSCPNRDGTCGTGGCTFCNNRAFNPSYNDPALPIREQIRMGMAFHRTRYRKVKRYLAYFQAYSNTYDDLEILRSRYEEALSVPGVIGLVIGTRPDCVDPEKLDYLGKLAKKVYLVVEYGIESLKDQTLHRVNRGHDSALTRWAVEQTASRGIRVGGHLILGLPGEKRSDFIESVTRLSSWPLDNIKFHQLQVIRGTAMEKEYRRTPGDFVTFSLDAYLELMVELVQQLNPGIVVERIAGEVNPDMAVTKGWGVRYDAVVSAFDRLLEEKDTWQGRTFNTSKDETLS